MHLVLFFFLVQFLTSSVFSVEVFTMFMWGLDVVELSICVVQKTVPQSRNSGLLVHAL